MTSQAQIEQAVFTSACSREHDGYHLVATSPGVSAQDSRELAVWGPTHDSLADHCPASGSINYHMLPSGSFCVSSTIASGSEYSNRGGHRIYTQCLLVPGSVMSRFAHNPFRVIEAASASGRLDVTERVPDELEAFRLIGRAVSLDRDVLRWITSDLGPRRCAALLQATVANQYVRIIGGSGPERLLRALFSLLPPPCRRDLSMSTGLRYSTRRPYRIMALETDPSLHYRLTQREDTVLLDLSEKSSVSVTNFEPWVDRILEVLRSERWEQLAEWYGDLGGEVRPEDLNRIADRWRHTPRVAMPSRDDQRRKTASNRLFQEPVSRSNVSPSPSRTDTITPCSTTTARLGRRCQPRVTRGPSGAISGSADSLDLDHAALMEHLEELDAAVLDAIRGIDGALHRVRTMWPEVLSCLPSPLVDESRQQYVHFAVRGWQDADGGQEGRDPCRAIAALDVLATLFETR